MVIRGGPELLLSGMRAGGVRAPHHHPPTHTRVAGEQTLSPEGMQRGWGGSARESRAPQAHRSSLPRFLKQTAPNSPNIKSQMGSTE